MKLASHNGRHWSGNGAMKGSQAYSHTYGYAASCMKLAPVLIFFTVYSSNTSKVGSLLKLRRDMPPARILQNLQQELELIVNNLVHEASFSCFFR